MLAKPNYSNEYLENFSKVKDVEVKINEQIFYNISSEIYQSKSHPDNLVPILKIQAVKPVTVDASIALTKKVRELFNLIPAARYINTTPFIILDSHGQESSQMISQLAMSKGLKLINKLFEDFHIKKEGRIIVITHFNYAVEVAGKALTYQSNANRKKLINVNVEKEAYEIIDSIIKFDYVI